MNIFGYLPGRNYVWCPKCTEKVLVINDQKMCVRCRYSLPKEYIDNYGKHPPLFLPIIGGTGVGKTVYLRLLLLTLRRMSRLWTGCSALPANQETNEYIHKAEQMFVDNRLPSATDSGSFDIQMLYLHGFPRWTDITFVTRDYSGEAFRALEFEREDVPFIANVPLLLMMLSIEEVIAGKYELDELIHSYIHTTREWGINLTRRPKHIIIVLSKGDILLKLNRKFPRSLCTHLHSDELWTHINNMTKSGSPPPQFRLDSYINYLNKIDGTIRKFFSRELAPINAIAEQYGIETKYSLISSLGSQPNGKTMAQPIHPHRVLDPFIWAYEIYSCKREARTIY